MSKKIIERRWKEGLIGLLWTRLSNNRVFLFSKILFSKVLNYVPPRNNGGGLENNLLHPSGNYSDDKPISNISYYKKFLGKFWDGFPIKRSL